MAKYLAKDQTETSIIYVSGHPLQTTGGADISMLEIDGIGSYWVDNAEDADLRLTCPGYSGVLMRDMPLPLKGANPDFGPKSWEGGRQFILDVKDRGLPLILLAIDDEERRARLQKSLKIEVFDFAAPYENWRETALRLFKNN